MTAVTTARTLASSIISRAGITQPPVPVEDMAKQRGIAVQYVPLDDDLSGMAFIKEGVSFIVVNAGHHPNRQRFTLAHEFGHHVLHPDALVGTVHVDKAILRRDSLAQQGTNLREIAANAFAAELLMPEALIKPFIRDLDMNDERSVDAVARAFKVSTAALNFRMLAPTQRRRQPRLI